MIRYIQVGRTVVGAFESSHALTRCINALHPGTCPVIKKGYKPDEPVPQYRSKETAQHPSKVTYLKPGEFKL